MEAENKYDLERHKERKIFLLNNCHDDSFAEITVLIIAQSNADNFNWPQESVTRNLLDWC